MKVQELAATIHPYPTYLTPIQQMAAEFAVEHRLGGTSGKIRSRTQQIGKLETRERGTE